MWNLREQLLNKIAKPHFLTIKYKVNSVTTYNTLTIDFSKFIEILEKNKSASFFLCLMCHIKVYRSCRYCTPFMQYPRTFILKTSKRFYCMPQPSLFTKKNYSYFQSIIWFIYKVHINELNDTTVPHNLQYPKRLIYRQAPLFRIPKHIIDMEHLKYYQFINDKFKGGSLMQQKSGKLSYMRVRILGVNALGLRMTLTIDNNLGPNDVSIPRHMFDCLDLATPYVIINRDPSINDCAIYACELLSYRNLNDNTIHVNPYVLEGLHADQDGDDLNVYYLKRDKEIPSFLMLRATSELLRLSWKYGRRRNVCNQSKYSFGQYHMLLLQLYDNYFQDKSMLWKSLSFTYQNVSERAKVLMQLGCTIWRDDIDVFINVLQNFGARICLSLTTVNEMINGTGILLDVIKSGAKGSLEHIKMFTNVLQEHTEIGKKNYICNLQQSFNNYVNASKSISLLGQQLFILLSVFQPLYLLSNDIYIKNNTRIIKNVSKCLFYNKWIYQIEAVFSTFNDLKRHKKSQTQINSDFVMSPNILLKKYKINQISRNTISFEPRKIENCRVVRYFDSLGRTAEINSSSNFILARPHSILYSKYGNYVSRDYRRLVSIDMLYERVCDYLKSIRNSDELHNYLVIDSIKIIPVLHKLPSNYKNKFYFLRIIY
ncbi:uncharacterized LOC118064850 [Chelonus insularis]|uniref:uncharacterized LOC118064850 n=1 Tax=Chelonus insularis TaxID=460826 RepID=UPI00158D6922|nr:uncharacterized LOC118064850 [Chelonus insularis]KAG8148349.1 putative RNA polymerase subunit lef-9 [Chelonus insularis]